LALTSLQVAADLSLFVMMLSIEALWHDPAVQYLLHDFEALHRNP
jgi:hypothetical protein